VAVNADAGGHGAGAALPFLAVVVVGLLAVAVGAYWVVAVMPRGDGPGEGGGRVAAAPDAGRGATSTQRPVARDGGSEPVRPSAAAWSAGGDDAAPAGGDDDDAAPPGDVDAGGVPTPLAAFLSVTSVPPSAKVVLDGRTTGERTPVRDLPLDPGEHLVEVVLDAHERWRKRVTLDLGETVSLRAVLAPEAGAAATTPVAPVGDEEYGMLSVDTVPPSRVFRGRESLGETPLSGIELPAGSHTLTFVVDGGRRYRKSISILAGRSTRREFDFTEPRSEGP
jgi:hypothetical protein